MIRGILEELQQIKKTLQSIDNKLESQRLKVTQTINSSNQLTEREIAKQSKIELHQISKQLGN